MEGHFTYLTPVFHDENWEKLAAAAILAAVLLVFGTLLMRRINSAAKRDEQMVPAKRIGVFGIFDLFMSTFIGFHDSVLGKEKRCHAGFNGSMFLFVLSANMLGLFPGIPAITTTVWVNVGMALVVFVYFNYQGVRTHGALGYLRHFGGPVIWLAWFMFPLEIFSTCLRVLTLNLRLYWNITADHMVLGIFTDLLFPGAASVMYILGAFVSFMQAFIFTTLSMIYIMIATQYEEGAHH